MYRLFAVLSLFLAGAISLVPGQEAQKPFPRGAKPTPLAKIIESIKVGKSKIYRASAPPPSVIVVPKRLSMWGNSQYGDCVSAESACSMASYSTMVGIDEIFVTEAAIVAWARGHGYLNGADLLEVIQSMQADGIKDENGILRKAGTPSSVDYGNETTLQSALAQGQVSIAIDANALPSGAGSKSGWYAVGGRNYPNTDHCVGLLGYAKASDAFKALNAQLPASIDQNKMMYFLFTWNTIGLVDHDWLMKTCVEAWVRNPTVTGLQPPPPPVTTVTVKVADVSGTVGTPIKFTVSASGGTSPYIFAFDYGDGTNDLSGSHTYKVNGSYKATVTAVDSNGQTGTATATVTVGVAPPNPNPNPNPNPGPTPGGLTITLPQATPAGTYSLVLPSDLDALQQELQRRIDAIRGKSVQTTPMVP